MICGSCPGYKLGIVLENSTVSCRATPGTTQVNGMSQWALSPKWDAVMTSQKQCTGLICFIPGFHMIKAKSCRAALYNMMPDGNMRTYFVACTASHLP